MAVPVGRLSDWLVKNSTLAERMVLAVLTISGGAIRAYNIVAKSLWFDEAVVFWISREEDLSSMIAANAQMNSAPPFYVILVHLVSEIGTNEAILRSISWLAGTAAIPLIYMLGVRYVSKRAALASATILRCHASLCRILAAAQGVLLGILHFCSDASCIRGIQREWLVEEPGFCRGHLWHRHLHSIWPWSIDSLPQHCVPRGSHVVP